MRCAGILFNSRGFFHVFSLINSILPSYQQLHNGYDSKSSQSNFNLFAKYLLDVNICFGFHRHIVAFFVAKPIECVNTIKLFHFFHRCSYLIFSSLLVFVDSFFWALICDRNQHKKSPSVCEHEHGPYIHAENVLLANHC